MKNKLFLIPGALLGLAATASAAVPAEVTGILSDLELVNTAVATTAGIIIITWMAFRLAKRAK